MVQDVSYLNQQEMYSYVDHFFRNAQAYFTQLAAKR